MAPLTNSVNSSIYVLQILKYETSTGAEGGTCDCGCARLTLRSATENKVEAFNALIRITFFKTPRKAGLKPDSQGQDYGPFEQTIQHIVVFS